MTESAPLVIRADASPSIGAGHVMRCLAIAAAYRADARPPRRVDLVSARALPGSLGERVAEEGVEARVTGAEIGSPGDADATLAIAAKIGARSIVVDGYDFSGAFEASLRAAGQRVIALDDYVHNEHVADLVVNPGLHGSASMYASLPPHSRVLAGPTFALLRSEFWRFRDRVPRTRTSVRNVLVTLGGSDPGKVTPRIVAGLAGLGLSVRVVVGAATAGGDDTARVAMEAGFDVVRGPRDMSSHMDWADLAVASAGVTLLELSFMKTPALLVIAADNQRGGAVEAERLGAACILGAGSEVTPADVARRVSSLAGDAGSLERMSARGREIIDGHGAGRLVGALAR